MKSRTYRYRQWLKHLKEQEMAYYNDLSYELEYNRAVEEILEHAKRSQPMDETEMFGNIIPDVGGESFMGLIPYIQAKIKGEPVSEFQDRCWMYGSGQERRNDDAQ